MTLPNFLIIGAAKSGTTALYRYLYDHPQVFLSERKELHFFSYPETSKLTKGPDTYKRIAVASLKEYERFFENTRSRKAIGEASPSYLYLSGTAERIHGTVPQAKLIAILRDPVERAYSAYMHAIRDGWEPITNFEEALAQETRRVEAGWEIAWHYTRMGFYYQQLKRYYDIFDRSQIRVFLYDDLLNDPGRLVRDICGFLGVEEEFNPDMRVRPNVSGALYSKTLYQLTNRLFLEPNLIKTWARSVLPESVRWRFTTRVRNINIRKIPLPTESRRRLIPLFEADILHLAQLIDRDLSNWLKP